MLIFHIWDESYFYFKLFKRCYERVKLWATRFRREGYYFIKILMYFVGYFSCFRHFVNLWFKQIPNKRKAAIDPRSAPLCSTVLPWGRARPITTQRELYQEVRKLTDFFTAYSAHKYMTFISVELPNNILSK